MPKRFILCVVFLSSIVMLLVVLTEFPAALIDPPTVEHIAQQMEQRYLSAAYIEMEGRSERPEEAIEFKYEGTQDSFRTTSWQSGAPYGCFSLHAGRVQEWVPNDPKNLVLCYDAECEEDSISQLVYPRPSDCNYGVMFALWIGSKSPMVASFQTALRQSVISGETSVGKYRCWVLERALTLAPPDGEKEATVITHIYYIDQSNFILRRWDTKRPNGLQRREYTRVQISDTRPEKDWTVITPLTRPAAFISGKPIGVTQ